MSRIGVYLIPQPPADTPHIRAVLEKVAKGGNSKESRQWEKYTIASMSQTCSGSTPSRSHKEYFDGNIPWVKTGELKDNTIYDTEEHISEAAVRETSVKLLSEGTVLVARGYLQIIGSRT